MTRLFKSKRRWLVLLAVLLLFGLGAWWMVPREPSYEGRSLSKWLMKFSLYPVPLRPPTAQLAIRAMGTNSLPWLVKYLRPEHKAVRVVRRWAGTSTNGVIQSLLPPPDRDWQATIAFLTLGQDAAPAIPELMKLVDQQPEKVPQILGYLGTNALPELVKLLESTNVVVLESTLFGLRASMRENQVSQKLANQAAPRLIALADHPKMEVQFQAIQCLGSMIGIAKGAVPAMANLLSDPDTDAVVRAVALRSTDTTVLETMLASNNLDPKVREDAQRILIHYEEERSVLRVLK